MSLRELARLTGLDHSYLSRLERGLAGAGPETAERIATALGVPPAITRGDPVPTSTDLDQVPHPASPEGQIYLYTPEQASPHLKMSPLQIRRKAYKRLIPFTECGRAVHITGAQIVELIKAQEVRPLVERPKPRRQKNPAA